MVAGSGPDPGSADKAKSKALYDGKLDSWPAAKIKIKWLELRRLPPIMGFVGSGPGLVIILA